MKECKKSELLFDGAFFGILDKEDQLFLVQHLEHCGKCQRELEQNNSMLSVIANKKTSAPPAEFWENYTTKLQQRMISEGLLNENQPVTKPAQQKGPLKQLFGRFAAPAVPGWVFQGTAAVVLVILGIFIGWQFFAPHPNGEPELASHISLESAKQAPGIMQQVGNFIDRSRVILLAIENFDLETESMHAINLPYQKMISRELADQAVSLKKDLSKARQRRLKELITELEVLLLQIANMDAGSEMETLQLVKDGRYIRGMLYKIRVIDLQRSKDKTRMLKSI